MGCYYCDRCGHEHAGQVRTCQRCGVAGVWYRPTPQEIRAECRKIQAGWSESEELSRRFGCASLTARSKLEVHMDVVHAVTTEGPARAD